VSVSHIHFDSFSQVKFVEHF